MFILCPLLAIVGKKISGTLDRWAVEYPILYCQAIEQLNKACARVSRTGARRDASALNIQN